MSLSLLRLCALSLALGALAACHARVAPGAAAKATAPEMGCVPGERGYLHLKLRGAIDAEPNWRGAELQCEGGARPNGRGLRVSFLGPAEADGARIRLVFGIATGPGLGVSRGVPTNITVIVEGRKQLYATQGDDKCQIESMVQEPLTPTGAAARAASVRAYRIAARGYCIDPASSLDGAERLYIDRFDFAGLASFAENELYASIPPH